ncbi:hypothetical protein [Bradyrhizobium sp. 2S1]|uniref:hypothetical protein n=1 Tax=Bradyrhizobium sp. 2S1 TaxID=1404429 RepID=UPI00140838E8|nr:hypothetical protein [Bradyrhizobium sp. 2S1]MCK7673434.1 hypothetical protein [Bradyrhizobium sp. 2S1]
MAAIRNAGAQLTPAAKRSYGLAPSLWIYDEFAQAPNSDLLNNLRTATGKRRESLGVIISTQAANDQHPLSQMIDDAMLGVETNAQAGASRVLGSIQGRHRPLLRRYRQPPAVYQMGTEAPGRILLDVH